MNLNIDFIGSVVNKALKSYTCQHSKNYDGDGISLVDRLTPDDDTTIKRGELELELLSDSIACAVHDVCIDVNKKEIVSYEVRWTQGNGNRTIEVPTKQEARAIFQTCINHGMSCALVRIERTKTIEAAWEWME